MTKQKNLLGDSFIVGYNTRISNTMLVRYPSPRHDVSARR